MPQSKNTSEMTSVRNNAQSGRVVDPRSLANTPPGCNRPGAKSPNHTEWALIQQVLCATFLAEYFGGILTRVGVGNEQEQQVGRGGLFRCKRSCLPNSWINPPPSRGVIWLGTTLMSGDDEAIVEVQKFVVDSRVGLWRCYLSKMTGFTWRRLGREGQRKANLARPGRLRTETLTKSERNRKFSTEIY